VLSLGILGFGLTVGAIDQLLLNRQGPGIDWTMALVAGFTGSFVGMLFSMIAGDGLKLRLSGVLGPIHWCSHRHRHLGRHERREAKAARAATKAGSRSGRPNKFSQRRHFAIG